MTLAQLVGLFLALAPPLAVEAQSIPRIGVLCDPLDSNGRSIFSRRGTSA